MDIQDGGLIEENLDPYGLEGLSHIQENRCCYPRLVKVPVDSFDETGQPHRRDVSVLLKTVIRKVIGRWGRCFRTTFAVPFPESGVVDIMPINIRRNMWKALKFCGLGRYSDAKIKVLSKVNIQKYIKIYINFHMSRRAVT
jgi:hypothetical protein